MYAHIFWNERYEDCGIEPFLVFIETTLRTYSVKFTLLLIFLWLERAISLPDDQVLIICVI